MIRILFSAAFAVILAFAPGIACAQMDSDFSSGGAVRVGGSTSTCTSGRSGAVRYNSASSGSIELCNGSSWATVGSGAPGGSSTQVQFNDSGTFGGDSGITYDKTNDALTVAGKITLGAVSGLSAPTSAIVAGSNTQIQFNSGGNFGASANLTWKNAEGHLFFSGSTPTQSGTTCGNASFAAAGNDNAFKITTGTTAATTCVINFANTWSSNAPVCALSLTAPTATYTAYISAISTTSMTVTFSTSAASRVFYVLCRGYN